MDSTEFLPAINWETTIYDVALISEETEENPAVWECRIKPRDYNDIGSDIPVELDFQLVDNAGHCFRITNKDKYAAEKRVQVTDIFRVWPECPHPDLTGFVCKTVGDGESPHITPAMLDRLDDKAKDYLQSIEKDILWKYPKDINEKWHPEGLVFSIDKTNNKLIKWTAGKFVITKWPEGLESEYRIENVINKSAYHPERKYNINSGTFTCADDEMVYIYAVVPIAKNELSGSIVIEKTYRFERYYTGMLTVLIGVYNVPNEEGVRALSMQWGGGDIINTKKITIINNHTTLTNIVENILYYDLTYQAFYSYINNQWITFNNTTIIDDRDIITTIVENHVYYETTTQQFITYINNEWISLDQQPETIYPESENQTATGKHTHKFNPGKLVTQPDHGFIFGNTIKRDGAGAWIKSKANTRANAGTVGIVSEVIDADQFRYITGGLLPGDFVDGADYWLSTTTAGEIFIQSDPEVWEIGNVREFIGTGTVNGLEVEIDLGDEITEFDLGGGGGASNDVVSGAGMDFETNDPVTLGLPSEVNSTTVNEVTTHSHTHKLGEINLPNLVQKIDWSYLYNAFVTIDSRKITSSDDFDIPTADQLRELTEYMGATTDSWGFTEENNLAYKVRTDDNIYWESPNVDSTNEYNLSIIGSGSRSGMSYDIYPGEFWGIKQSSWIWSKTEYANSTEQNWCLVAFHSAYQGGILRVTTKEKLAGLSIRLVRPATYQESLGEDGIMATNYVGNNGIIYSLVKIGNNVFTVENLRETEWRDHTPIFYVPGNDDWAALYNSAYCIYTVPLKNLLDHDHNNLKKIDAGDPDNNYYGHLTQAQLQLIQSFFDLPTYADNAEALADGLQAGNLYKTLIGQLMIVY